MARALVSWAAEAGGGFPESQGEVFGTCLGRGGQLLRAREWHDLVSIDVTHSGAVLRGHVEVGREWGGGCGFGGAIIRGFCSASPSWI